MRTQFSRWILKGYFLSVPLFLMSLTATAQADRDPNPQEKDAINKLVGVIDPLINAFANKDWKKIEGGAIEQQGYSVQKKPSCPMGTAPFNDWQFDIKENSELWQQLIKPLQEKLLQPPSDMTDKKAWDDYTSAGEKIKNLQHIYVEVRVNEILLPVKPAKGSSNDLKIPGCWFAYKQSADKRTGTDRNLKNSYVLAFGNWGNSKYQGADDVYLFHFTHATSTPYIENVVIIITGNDDAIREILQKTNWKTINASLTL